MAEIDRVLSRHPVGEKASIPCQLSMPTRPSSGNQFTGSADGRRTPPSCQGDVLYSRYLLPRSENPDRFELLMYDYRKLWDDFTLLRRSITERPFSAEQKALLEARLEEINQKREELRQEVSALRDSDTNLTQWTSIRELQATLPESALRPLVECAVTHMSFPVFLTHVGRVIYANKLFQDLFEVSEEMIQEGSLSMEDLLTSRGMPFYVEFLSQLYSGEITSAGPCAFFANLFTYKTRRLVQGVFMVRPFSMPPNGRRSVCQFIPNVHPSLPDLLVKMKSAKS